MSNKLNEKWHFTIILHAVYAAVFTAWIFVQESALNVWLIASISSAVLIGLGIRAHKQGYFFSWAERFMHAAVIVDILAEAWFIAQPTLVRHHPGPDFLLCAVGFAVVIGGYRYYHLRMKQQESPQS